MIKEGTYEDIETLLPLAKEMHGTSIYKDTHYDENIVRGYASRFCGNPNKYFRVYYKGDKPMAYLLGYIDQSSQLAGFKLLKDFEKWAKEKGCKEVNYSVTYAGAPNEQYDKVMTRMGYTKQGAIYKKGIV